MIYLSHKVCEISHLISLYGISSFTRKELSYEKSHVERAGRRQDHLAVLVALYYWMWARNDWKNFYPTIQTVVGGFTFWYFVFRAIRVRKYKQEAADEMAEANLHRCDSICLKVCRAALIGIGFACAIGRLVLTTEVIGYCLMGTLILMEVVRTVAFWLMDEKGL